MSHLIISALDNAYPTQDHHVADNSNWVKDARFGVGLLITVGGAAVMFSNLIVLLT